MKTAIGKLAVLALAILAIGAIVAHAQIINQLDFTVTQSFTVGNTTLPAGSYTIRTVSGTEAFLEVSGASGAPSVMVETFSVQPDAAQRGSHVVFNKYNNVLALSQVFPGAGNTGYQLSAQGQQEKLAAKTETPTKQSVTSTAK
jgi:hypothetical protein